MTLADWRMLMYTSHWSSVFCRIRKLKGQIRMTTSLPLSTWRGQI